ncbi:IFRD-domain-containing protein [Thozetella sp. PMI_491]|nr:IFRD-domain-containing protein [Thozetella sp. PMI_491]
MHDLRKKALLESGKTVSRKARSKPESLRSSANHSPITSPIGSRAGSRPGSRPGSRYASEDEFASDSDWDSDDEVLTVSTNSDDLDEDGNVEEWADRLHDRIVEMQDRKHLSAERREATLNSYLHLVRHHFAGREIERNFEGITQALLRSARSGSSDREQSMALKALAVTILSAASDSVLAEVFEALKKACSDSEEESIKVEAIHALAIATMYGGGSTNAAEEVLEFLLDIVETDGSAVEAEDNGAVVTAALQAWAFVASHLEDLSAESDRSMDAFIDQLDSSDPDVLTSAGACIALLFESARDYEEETGESFDLNYNKHRIMTRMNEIVRDSSKSVAKKQRRQLRQAFTSIITSIERGKGPGYSTAGRSEANPHVAGGDADEDSAIVEFGYRQKVRIHNILMVIDTWSLYARVEVLKMLFGGGFPIHFMENPVIRNDILSGANTELIASQNSLKKRPEGDLKKKPRKARDRMAF